MGKVIQFKFGTQIDHADY